WYAVHKSGELAHENTPGHYERYNNGGYPSVEKKLEIFLIKLKTIFEFFDYIRQTTLNFIP
ncbi:MAG: hypothetical protein K2H96_00915, partial [Muribaculaceae bacterium]|nr:hypothetical protein [Muribaculaceae bacterium]